MILGAGSSSSSSTPPYVVPPPGAPSGSQLPPGAASFLPTDPLRPAPTPTPRGGWSFLPPPQAAPAATPLPPGAASLLPPAPGLQAPDGAVPVEDKVRKGPRTPKAGKGPKRPGDKRQLLDYEYELSAPELQRVRQENPAARGTIKVTDNTATPLSWEEYDKLSGDQRAAVDFNTLLVQAREIDLKTDPKWYSDADKAQYAKDVEAIFGPMGGSDTLGVKTVELLKKIDFKAVGQDLDEFLSLERAVSAKELENFEFSKNDLQQLDDFSITALAKPVEAASGYMKARTDENMAAVDTAAITAALKAYKGVITTGGGGVWDPAAALGPLQPSGAMMTMPVGYGRLGESANGKTTKLQVDTAVEELYGTLRAQPNETGLAAVFQDFKQWDWTPEEQQQLWDYVNDRTLRETQYLNDGGAKQIRDALGWK